MIPRLTLRVLCGETEMLMPLIYLSASKFHKCCFLKHSIIKLPDLNFATFLTSPHDLDCLKKKLWMEKTIAVTLSCILCFTCILLYILKWELNFILITYIKSVHSVSTPVYVKLTSSTYIKCWRSLNSLAYIWRSLNSLAYSTKPSFHTLLCFR
jgi:hypothetical protein